MAEDFSVLKREGRKEGKKSKPTSTKPCPFLVGSKIDQKQQAGQQIIAFFLAIVLSCSTDNAVLSTAEQCLNSVKAFSLLCPVHTLPSEELGSGQEAGRVCNQADVPN